MNDKVNSMLDWINKRVEITPQQREYISFGMTQLINEFPTEILIEKKDDVNEGMETLYVAIGDNLNIGDFVQIVGVNNDVIVVKKVDFDPKHHIHYIVNQATEPVYDSHCKGEFFKFQIRYQPRYYIRQLK